MEGLCTGWFKKEVSEYFGDYEVEFNKHTIQDVTLDIKPGEFLAVVGEVGSGKSSFLLSILGELDIRKGTLESSGSFGYVPQTAFLINATLRDNIIFGLPYDEQRYLEAIYYSDIIDDIKTLKSGDFTEIGEKGINLSGGQKQRINLARAFYADQDIYLIDDSLSALDNEVGGHIFFKGLKRRLQNKTKILVTHGVHFLEHVDRVLLM